MLLVEVVEVVEVKGRDEGRVRLRGARALFSLSLSDLDRGSERFSGSKKEKKKKRKKTILQCLRR
jgi:hypothetical protein